MAIPSTGSILHYLRQTILRRDGAGLTDGQLLRSYLVRHDEAAFEALVRRHGPMVRGVCRRVLRNPDDADDAFQAVFLVLLRKASALATREVIGDWLHGVAYRTALKARAAAARRQVKERRTARSEAVVDDEPRPDWLPLLDREIERLPQKYRLPVLLCDVQGRTRKEAAQQLGWPEGTVSGRLSRAREMLARRLTRCGVTLSAATAAMALTEEASAHLPFALIGSTCKAASGFAAGCAAGSVPGHVAALTEGVVKAMLLSKVKNVVALLAVALVLTAGVGVWHYAPAAGQSEERREEEKSVPMPRHRPTEDRPKPPAIPAPAAPRQLQFDLRIESETNGKRKLLAAPQLLSLEGKSAFCGIGQEFPLPQGNNKFEQVVMGPTVRLVTHSDTGGGICLDMTVSKVMQGTFGAGEAIVETKAIRIVRRVQFGKAVNAKLKIGDKEPSVLEVTATVWEVKPEREANTIASAEKDLKHAEFWRRTGHPDSALFYYELIRRRYPDTLYAERAKERMTELKKELEKQGVKSGMIEEKVPHRVGQIFLQGNKKISDEDILKHVTLVPGQILTPADLRIAERNLRKLKGLKVNPTVTILDPESKSVFNDIRITIEEE